MLNAADEQAVNLFLQGKFNFDQIPVKIKAAMDKHQNKENPSLGDILEADEIARSNLL